MGNVRRSQRTAVRSPKPAKPPLVTYAMLHLPVFSDADRSIQERLESKDRITGFEEVLSGLTEAQARYESQRCLSCGNCFECDNCYAACPEAAIAKLGPGKGYAVDNALCTGCATCFEQCPCHAIEMVRE